MKPLATPTVTEDPDAMRTCARELRRTSQSLALVPTMGALHRGHLALIDSARSLADVVVVSIFVNPMQFGEPADFEGYPRPIEADLAACADAGVDVVYAPTPAVMYPAGFDTSVVPGSLASVMEGKSRPGHFEGVTTVVTKLLAAVGPDTAVFGEKDFQQLAIIRRMVADLDLGVEIVAVATVREDDGVALSSRNRRLTAAQRSAAVVIPRAISAAAHMASRPSATIEEMIGAAQWVLAAEPLASVDYVSVFHADTLQTVTTDIERVPGHYRIAVAARFGDVRLIDNAELFLE